MSIQSLVKNTENILLEMDMICSGDLFILSSFSREDMIILHIMLSMGMKRDVVTIDTGRIYQETFEFMERIRDEWNVSIKFLFPDRSEVEYMVDNFGPNLFYKSREMREMCCKIRKADPLKKILSERKGWITGIRREQTSLRMNANHMEYSGRNVKCNPLLDWKYSDVMEYTLRNGIPENILYKRGYKSIGCLPCTAPSEWERDGRWWWEDGVKECGIHRDEVMK